MPGPEPETLPRLTVNRLDTGDISTSIYTLTRPEEGYPNDHPLSYDQYRIVHSLARHAPNLAYVSRLISDSYGALRLTTPEANNVSGEQYLAEAMHKLSQPFLLGDKLRWETHGPLIVGYRLLATVDFVDQKPPTTEQPVKRSGGLRGLLHRQP